MDEATMWVAVDWGAGRFPTADGKLVVAVVPDAVGLDTLGMQQVCVQVCCEMNSKHPG